MTSVVAATFIGHNQAGSWQVVTSQHQGADSSCYGGFVDPKSPEEPDSQAGSHGIMHQQAFSSSSFLKSLPTKQPHTASCICRG